MSAEREFKPPTPRPAITTVSLITPAGDIERKWAGDGLASMPRPGRPKQQPLPEHIEAEWFHLQRWVEKNKDLLSIAGIGARAELSRAQAVALLTIPAAAAPGPAPMRVAKTLPRLIALQNACSALGYKPSLMQGHKCAACHKPTFAAVLSKHGGFCEHCDGLFPLEH